MVYFSFIYDSIISMMRINMHYKIYRNTIPDSSFARKKLKPSLKLRFRSIIFRVNKKSTKNILNLLYNV